MSMQGLNEMRKDVADRTNELYQWWLMEKEVEYGKDELIEMFMCGHRYKEFEEWLQEAM